MSDLITLIQEYNLQELVTVGIGFSIGIFESVYENFLDKKFDINKSNKKPSRMDYAFIGGIITGINKNPYAGFGSDWDRAIVSGVLGTISYGIGYKLSNKIIRNISNNSERQK